jgi:hypothetical protein
VEFFVTLILGVIGFVVVRVLFRKSLDQARSAAPSRYRYHQLHA